MGVFGDLHSFKLDCYTPVFYKIRMFQSLKKTCL